MGSVGKNHVSLEVFFIKPKVSVIWTCRFCWSYAPAERCQHVLCMRCLSTASSGIVIVVQLYRSVEQSVIVAPISLVSGLIGHHR